MFFCLSVGSPHRKL